jgi:hypothetical protein
MSASVEYLIRYDSQISSVSRAANPGFFRYNCFRSKRRHHAEENNLSPLEASD